MKTDPLFDIGMPSFYGEIMHAWRLSGAWLDIIHDSVSHVLNLPIYIPLIQNATDDGASHSTRLSARGVGLVRDLLNFTSGLWHQPNDVISSSTSLPPSSRLLQKQLSSICKRLLSVYSLLCSTRRDFTYMFQLCKMFPQNQTVPSTSSSTTWTMQSPHHPKYSTM